MKKFILCFLTLLVLLIVILIFPHKTEHAIVTNSSENFMNVYVNGEYKQINSNLNLPSFTVINYNYNFFYAFNIKEVSSINERIMKKIDNHYDLEKSGLISTSNKIRFYEVVNNSLVPCTSKKLIVGKSNIKSYVDKKGELRTFLIYPYNYSNIRVGISTTGFSSLSHKSVSIYCNHDCNIYSIKDNLSISVPTNSKIVIKPYNNSLSLTIDNKTQIFNNRLYIKGNSINIESIKRGYPSFTPSYNGILEFTNSNKNISIINETSLEDYLCKVVPSEIPVSSGLEALKCQAIAARTYALSDMLGNRFSKLGFYVDDSTQSQVYNNIKTYPSSNKAVNLTKGIIMTYNSFPIDAKYYSTSCGIGTNYESVWFKKHGSSDDKPYYYTGSYLFNKSDLPNTEEQWLKFYKSNAKAIDSSSPYFRWHIDFPVNALENSLKKSLKNLFENRKDFITAYVKNTITDDFPNISSIKDIKILKRSPYGNIIELSFVFDNACINVKGDSAIRSALRCDDAFTEEKIYLIKNNNTSSDNFKVPPSSFFSIEKKGDLFVVYGGGYGHGVGMSQYGTMNLAKKGLGYKAILNSFYKDIEFNKIY